MTRVKSWMLVVSCVVILAVGCGDSTTTSPTMERPTVEAASESIANWSVQLIREYLDTKPWGFFGASCEQWLEIDYLINMPTATVESDGRIHVSFHRHPDRMLGPEEVKYHVDLGTSTVTGDHGSTGDRLGTTEGCDQW